MTAALVPGSFDPPTNGHLDVIERCVGIFDKVIVGVIRNPSKSPLFDESERIAMLTELCSQWDTVSVGSFDGLLVDYAKQTGADVVVKGLRAITDFDYEFQMSQMNRHLSGIVTLFDSGTWRAFSISIIRFSSMSSSPPGTGGGACG